MADDSTPNSASAVPQAVADEKRSGISMIWIVPVVAALIGVWLVYKTISEQGPDATISFKTASGLEVGKTKVKFRDVEVGVVDNIRLAEDISKVFVTVALEHGSDPYLRENTKFWVVRPRLDASGVSGLDTLVSGAYIEIEPGDGAETRTFKGLEIPPIVRTDAVGTKFILRAASLGSLSPRSPIYFRGIKVGEILGSRLENNNSSVRIHAFVDEPYDKIVSSETRFWNASGISVKAGAEGFEIQTESIQALLAGGVAFETPSLATPVQRAKAGTVFPLYAHKDAARDRAITVKRPYLLVFDDSVRGLDPGAEVDFRGVRVGTVKDIRFNIDYSTFKISISVIVDMEPERIKSVHATGDKAKDATKADAYLGMSILVERGLRAQLETSSLITGKQFVSLDFHEEAGKKTLRMEGIYPEIPTIPSTINEIANVAQRILVKIEKLPLEVLIKDVRTMMASADATMRDAQKLVRDVDDQVSPVFSQLKKVLAEGDKTLEKAESVLNNVDSAVAPNSELRLSLAETLQELAGAARSIRLLADYLERHPEALVRGKTGEAR